MKQVHRIAEQLTALTKVVSQTCFNGLLNRNIGSPNLRNSILIHEFDNRVQSPLRPRADTGLDLSHSPSVSSLEVQNQERRFDSLWVEFGQAFWISDWIEVEYSGRRLS